MDANSTTLMLVTDPAVNMAPLYITMGAAEKKGKFPAQITVVKSLPDNKKCFHFRSASGYDVISLKLDSIDKMKGRCLSELGRLASPKLPVVGTLATYEDGQSVDTSSSFKEDMIGLLETILLDSSDILQINCPQFTFLPDPNSAGSYIMDSESNISVLYLNPCNYMPFYAAHEMRHAWQAKYHKEWFRNYESLGKCRYKYGEKSSDVYNSQITEFDANVFACALLRSYSRDMDQPYYADKTPLHLATDKAASALLRLWKTNDFAGVPDYKSIYPDVII